MRSDKYNAESETLSRNNPIVSIGLDNFQKEVLEENSPVLVLCMYRDAEFQKQIDVIESACGSYVGRLKVCLIEEGFIGAFRENLDVKGTPTFMLFTNGTKKGRLLGQVQQKTLQDFLSQTMSID